MACAHRLVVDEIDDEECDCYGPGYEPGSVWDPHPKGEHGYLRVCLTCGLSYDRLAVLRRLEAAIRARYRLPPSPWTSAERSNDLW